VVDCPVQPLLPAADDVLDDSAPAGPAGRLGSGDVLSGDAVVLARMNAAVDVMLAAGIEVDRADEIGGYLRRAVRWHRRATDRSAPVWYRRCAADIARGSLRLWVRAGGVPQPVPEPVKLGAGVRDRRARAVLLRGQAQLARVQLSARARTICIALRTDLSREVAELSRAGLQVFDGRVRREVLRVSDEFDAALRLRLAELAESAGISSAELARVPGAGAEPPVVPHRRPRLEHRLTALLGIGFGFGVSLTAGRVIAELRPDWAAPAAAVCGGLGLVLTYWIVGARRLLVERAAMERGVADAVANLRATLDERVATRVLELESALAAHSAARVPQQRPAPVGHMPDYRSQTGPR